MPASTCRTREAVLERGRTDCAAASCEELRRWRFQAGESPPNRNERQPGTGGGAGRPPGGVGYVFFFGDRYPVTTRVRGPLPAPPSSFSLRTASFSVQILT